MSIIKAQLAISGGTFDFLGEQLSEKEIKEKLEDEYVLITSTMTVGDRVRCTGTYERIKQSINGDRVREIVEVKTIGGSMQVGNIVSLSFKFKLMESSLAKRIFEFKPTRSLLKMWDIEKDRRKEIDDIAKIPPFLLGESDNKLSSADRDNLKLQWEEQYTGYGPMTPAKKEVSKEDKKLSASIIKGKRKLQL